MGNIVTPTDIFERKVKRLIKKFPTLSAALLDLEEDLVADPFKGDKLGNKTYKVRVADKSKGKGKSGGFRVITYLVNQAETYIEILLLTIYDKSEDDSIASSEIKKMVEHVEAMRKAK